jgi:peptidoglycan-associated lipoprotein
MRFIIILLVCLLASCSRTTSETWEDMKTAGRHIQRGLKSLWGGDYESRQIASNEEFYGPEDEFVPLNDEDFSKEATSLSSIPKKTVKRQSTASAGIVDLDSFASPNAKMQNIFRTIHFSTDDHVVRDHQDLVTVARIANYMKKHRNSYLIVEGHCDKRASADYNMALGMRRAHHIRVLLAKQGVDSSRIYTISYGKEKPVAYGDTKDAFFKNRRAQFKIKLQ